MAAASWARSSRPSRSTPAVPGGSPYEPPPHEIASPARCARVGHDSAGDPMRLTVIGTSGSYPGPDSSASCYLLEEEHLGRTWRILLDLGNGALGSLQRYADASLVDAVFLSHLH